MRISIIDGVPRRTLTSDELTQLLERFPLERAAGRPLEGTTEAQVQLLFGRIAALTEALRGTESNETTRLASRMLLVDLDFRGSSFQRTHEHDAVTARESARRAARPAP